MSEHFFIRQFLNFLQNVGNTGKWPMFPKSIWKGEALNQEHKSRLHQCNHHEYCCSFCICFQFFWIPGWIYFSQHSKNFTHTQHQTQTPETSEHRHTKKSLPPQLRFKKLYKILWRPSKEKEQCIVCWNPSSFVGLNLMAGVESNPTQMQNRMALQGSWMCT